MKAIRVSQFGPPEVMQPAEVPAPVLQPDEVLVRVHAAGVNPVDTYIRSGQYGKLPELPYTPGLDGAGVIEAAGPRQDRWKPGDRVFFARALSGAYAEYVRCGWQQVWALPDALTFAQGAALGVPAVTAYLALSARGHAAAGETVLIHGASGGVGIAAIQLARAGLLKVFATAGTEAGRRLAQQNGAEHVFDHTDPDHARQVMEKTGGKGIDLIIEMLANVNLATDLTLLAPRGRVCVVGSRGPIEINPRDLMTRSADIRGVLMASAPQAVLTSAYHAIERGITAGFVRPIVRAEYPAAEAPAAHIAVMASGAHGKIVLTFP